MSDLLRILAVLGLVAGNAFFVIGEYAVVTARRGAPRTLAGLVFDVLGHKPRPGDAVRAGGASLRVEALDGLRITRLRIALGGQEEVP